MNWQSYAGGLASHAEWAPVDLISRDALEKIKAGGEEWAVGYQAIRGVREVWKSLPPDVREIALERLDKIAETASLGFDVFDGIPIVEWIATAVKLVFGIGVGVAAEIGTIQDDSNFARGLAVRGTLDPLSGGADAVLVLPVLEYAEFVKIRAGGDFQRRPALRRVGGRDVVFTGRATPAGAGNCDKEIRRRSNESLGPFKAACGHKLALSALFYPWYSATYSPSPLPRYQWSSHGKGGSLSVDNNSFLAENQIRLLSDPARNLQCRLASVTRAAAHVRTWWGGAGHLHPVRWVKGDLVAWDPPAKWWADRGMAVGHRPRIDPTRDLQHTPTKGASSFWYLDGREIVRYPNQDHADLESWGKVLPAGKPGNLACSVTMLNGVEAVVAAFAARRLATIRSPALSRALLADVPRASIDPGALTALAYAGKQTGTLAYPGGAQRVKFAKLAPPLRKAVASAGTGKAGGAPLAVAAAAAFFLLR